MASRDREEQEMRNGLEVMSWIEHLVAHQDVSLDLDLVCYFNKLILQGTAGAYWAGRIRSTVDRQAPEDWARPRAIVAQDEHGLAVANPKTGELITRFPPDRDALGGAVAGWLAGLDYFG